MAKNFLNVLSDIKNLINSSLAKEELYKDSLSKIQNLLGKIEFYAVYFLNASSFEKKFSYPEHSTKFIPDEKLIEEIVNNKKQSFLYKNCIISKLLIKDSLFGFILVAPKEKPDKEEIQMLDVYTSVFSYLIKDAELSNVFKMQLAALQDAIKEKDAAYQIIEKQHKKLLELDSTKNSFLANISHELRTPLNAIVCFSQALDSKLFGDLNPKQADYIKDIHASSLHLLNMINEILDFSKIESGAMTLKPSEISPNTVISEVITILEPLSSRKNIKVNFESGCKSSIIADYQKFQQILYNLLSNAIKFTPQDGKIVIRTFEKGKKFILEVEDNGIGISKKDHNRIFAKFVQLNEIYSPSGGSTGLGLTITRELVNLHKGKIILKSALNHGSCFRIEFDGVKA